MRNIFWECSQREYPQARYHCPSAAQSHSECPLVACSLEYSKVQMECRRVLCPRKAPCYSQGQTVREPAYQLSIDLFVGFGCWRWTQESSSEVSALCPVLPFLAAVWGRDRQYSAAKGETAVSTPSLSAVRSSALVSPQGLKTEAVQFIVNMDPSALDDSEAYFLLM